EAAEKTPVTDNTVGTEETQASETSLWQWLSLLLAVSWGVTLLIWWRSRRHPAKAPVSDENRTEKARFDRLIKAAQDGSAKTPELLVEWANLHNPGAGFQSAAEVASHYRSEALTAEIRKLQARLFSAAPDPEPWDGRPMARVLEEIRATTGRPEILTDLPPLYPQGLR
ncbi:MAG: protein BatD, partial [Marinobacter sp.]|nr:protein BatD [Marinobacter sp.]